MARTLGKAAAAAYTMLAAGQLVSAQDPLSNMPDASVESIETVMQWARSLPAYGETQFAATGAPREPSPEYWGDLPMYQVMPDRFNNGDASNDVLNRPQFQVDELNRNSLNTVYLYAHGGDIRGMIDRLDYLAWMGIRVLYPTAINLNGGGDFHGYCVSNHLEIDPKFGTLAEYQELTREAHKRGIMVILDFVLNHVCDPNTQYVGGRPRGVARRECSDDMWAREVENNPNRNVRNRGTLQFGDTMFPPFKRQDFFGRCGTISSNELGFNEYEYLPMAVYNDFTDQMYDLETSNPNVQEMMTEIAKYWIAAADVDGFRLDATKHVSDGFVAYFSTQVRDYALDLGKDNFYIIGETISGYETQSRQLGSMRNDLTALTMQRLAEIQPVWSRHPKQAFPGLTATYDLSQGGAAKDVFRGTDNTRRIESTLADPARAEITSRADQGLFWVLLDQHDWPRLLSFGGDESERRSEAIASVAYSYSFTCKGIPYVYYGTEQGFNGNCYWDSMELGTDEALQNVRQQCSGTLKGTYDALYRQTMWLGGGYSLGMADRNRAATGPPRLVRIARPLEQANPFSKDWENDPFTRKSPTARHVRRLSFVRDSCKALRRGDQFFRWVDDGPGLLAYARIYGNQEILVIINARGDEKSLPSFYMDPSIAASAPTNQFVNLLNPDQSGFLEGGQLNLGWRLPGYGVAIMVRKDFAGEWCDEVEAVKCNDVEPSLVAQAPAKEDEGENQLNAEDPAASGTISPAAMAGAVAAPIGALAVVGAVLHQRRRRAQSGASADAVKSGPVVSPPELQP